MSDFVDGLKNGIEELIKSQVSEHADRARADATAFLEKSKEKLNRWAKLLAAGDLDKDDFTFLVESQRDLATMHALMEIGLAKVRIQNLVNGIINLIIDSAFKAM